MRYVIAIDGSGVYLRKTLCVTHDAVRGEVRYDTQPMKRTPPGMANLVRAIKRELAKNARRA